MQLWSKNTGILALIAEVLCTRRQYVLDHNCVLPEVGEQGLITKLEEYLVQKQAGSCEEVMAVPEITRWGL